MFYGTSAVQINNKPSIAVPNSPSVPAMKFNAKKFLVFPAIVIFLILLILNSNSLRLCLPLNQEVETVDDLWHSYGLAYKESYGFFDDIDEDTWQRHKNRAQLGQIYEKPENPNDGTSNGPMWLVSNVEPLFTCPNLRRVGGLGGDGPKWTCDPHRLAAKLDCLIYSVGSHGNFVFEDGIQDLMKQIAVSQLSIPVDTSNWLPNCEIHVFDPDPWYVREGDDKNKNIHYHAWGWKSSYQEFNKSYFPETNEFFTFQEIQKVLGHENRRIDILKIDCEACEYTTYADWMTPSVDIRQVLIETHGIPPWPSQFFDRFLDMGFVLFAKEANTIPEAEPAGELFEWGWVRLHPDFLNRSTSLQAM